MASIYDDQILSKKDAERVKKLGELWAQTDDEKKRAEYHDAAETIRRSYGYSGGMDGSRMNEIDKSVVSSALATKDYISAIEDAQQQNAQVYADMATQAEKDGNERLRQAYIKNMQQSLGIAQALKADGLTGGITESTKAAIGNNYLNLRDNIMEDVDDKKQSILQTQNKDISDSQKEIAKAEYEAAAKRADMLIQSEQRDYDRAQDAYNKEYQQKKDEYDRQWEQKLFEYQKELDKYDREYKAKNDELDRQSALKRSYISKSSTKTNSSDSDQEKVERERLEELRKRAWELLSKGVYDDSFPDLLGFSKENLLEYAENCMAGF